MKYAANRWCVPAFAQVCEAVRRDRPHHLNLPSRPPVPIAEKPNHCGCYPCFNAFFLIFQVSEHPPSPRPGAFGLDHMAAFSRRFLRRPGRFPLHAAPARRRRRGARTSRPAHRRKRRLDHTARSTASATLRSRPCPTGWSPSAYKIFGENTVVHPPAQRPRHAGPCLAFVGLGAPRLGRSRRPLCGPRRAHLHRPVSLYALHHSRVLSQSVPAHRALRAHYRPRAQHARIASTGARPVWRWPC